MHKIGLVYLPGSLPCFEDFGNLPTHVIREDGLVEGKPASEMLDLIIIPGGSLIESQSLKGSLTREILNMADSGKYVLGICSGLQVLAKATDIGRLSAKPMLRKGLGLLDAEFKPLICTDRVSATITGKSFMTRETDKEVTGFHCHTYGKMEIHKETKPILVSHIKRANYRKEPQDIVSGITNKEGNVVGILLHALLDENQIIIQSIAQSLNMSTEELQSIKKANSKLLFKIKREVGISTNVKAQDKYIQTLKKPSVLLIAATGSGSGKTFIVTGIAGALKKKGLNIGVAKVGGDIRDVVPALYLIKEPIKAYTSIKIGESGWKPLEEAVKEAGKKYDFLLVEGAMSAFTGLFNSETTRPTSTAEVALALGAPTIVVVACDTEGIEGAVVSALNYVNILKKLGIKIEGVVLNKVRVSYMTEEDKQFIKDAFKNAGAKLLGIVPRINLEGRGMIPEVEIRYEEFGAKAIDIVEQCLDLDAIAGFAKLPERGSVDYGLFLEKFKSSLFTSFKLKES